MRALALLALTATVFLCSPTRLASAQTRPAEPPFYSYALYLRAEPNRNLVSEAEAIARPMLKRHQLAGAAAVKAWDRTGQPLIAFERRSGPQKAYERLETNEGTPFSELFSSTLDRLLAGRTSPPITELVIRISAPKALDIASYVEGVEVAVTLARKLNAPAILDEETRERRGLKDWWENRAYEGQSREQPPRIISEQNPPQLALAGAIAQEPFKVGRGWYTRGMRKLGLPDLVLNDYLPGYSPHGFISTIANLLAAGRHPEEKTGNLLIDTTDPIVKNDLDGAENPNSKTAVRLVPARPFTDQPQGRVLEISFEAQPHPSLYERQMQVQTDLFKSRYPGLSSDDTRALSLAVARAKSKIRDLRERFAALQKSETRIFVATRVDAPLKTAQENQLSANWTQSWDVVMKWPKDGYLTARRWEGDPKTGGKVYRMSKPVVVGSTVYEFQDAQFPEGEIEDILVVDKNGKAEGGEVTELLRQLLPRVAKK